MQSLSPAQGLAILEMLLASKPTQVAAMPFNVRQECFVQCLQTISMESRQLITDYYKNEKRQKIDNRSSLAEKLGIPLNALRSRAQRVRDKLEQCIMRCCKKRDF